MYRCKDCNKKYNANTQVAAPDRKKKTPSISEARAASPTGQLTCPNCSSTRLTRCGVRGTNVRFRCGDCGTKTTFQKDVVRE